MQDCFGLVQEMGCPNSQGFSLKIGQIPLPWIHNDIIMEDSIVD
jgi:hypothetical protein